jgi:2-methylcitrate dehydratase PrpD
MATLAERIADFALGIAFEDLPEDVIEESKRILLDSIGCALGGAYTEKGKIALRFARQFGECPEATAIGLGDKVSVLGAAFANGEVMNALDYESVLSPGHVQPSFIIPAPMAMAEMQRASGRELILAIVLGFEIATRIGAGLPHYRDVVDGKVKAPAVYGFGCPVFGGTAGLGRVMGLDSRTLSNALGIAGYIAPIPSGGKFTRTRGVPSVKYTLAGWLCQAEVTAASLAEMGYSGDISVFEGEYGFWRFSGSDRWNPEPVMDKLGEKWRLLSTRYKYYPCCGALQTALDCFVNIVNENHLEPEEIERVDAFLEGFCDEPVFRNNVIRTQGDAQFSIAYLFSVAAYRVQIGPEWQDIALINEPKVLRFMDKVKFEIHPDYADVIQRDPTSNLSRVDVRARGRVFTEERTHHKGSPATEATKMSREQLVEKFKHNASLMLPRHKIDQASKHILELESLKDVSQLMESISTWDV